MEINFTPKNADFFCGNCDFICSKTSDWNRHVKTKKHLLRHNWKNWNTFTQDLHSKLNCIACGKKYMTYSGAWKHQKKCPNIEEHKNDKDKNDKDKNDKDKNDKDKKETDTETMIQYLLKENLEFKQLMVEQNKQMMELAKQNSDQMIELAKNAGTNNITNNNNFNLNVFLNETCKHAMNIMDFVSQLQVELDDLEETGRVGYANGISNIFIKGLKQLEVTHRPVHCSDPKRETLYIKNNDTWNKEDETKNTLLKAIKQVAHKNMNQIPVWREKHPDYNDSTSKENDKYLKIVSESMSGSTQEESNKNYNKIIRNIVKETIIDK